MTDIRLVVYRVCAGLVIACRYQDIVAVWPDQDELRLRSASLSLVETSPDALTRAPGPAQCCGVWSSGNVLCLRNFARKLDLKRHADIIEPPPVPRAMLPPPACLGKPLWAIVCLARGGQAARPGDGGLRHSGHIRDRMYTGRSNVLSDFHPGLICLFLTSDDSSLGVFVILESLPLLVHT